MFHAPLSENPGTLCLNCTSSVAMIVVLVRANHLRQRRVCWSKGVEVRGSLIGQKWGGISGVDWDRWEDLIASSFAEEWGCNFGEGFEEDDEVKDSRQGAKPSERPTMQLYCTMKMKMKWIESRRREKFQGHPRPICPHAKLSREREPLEPPHVNFALFFFFFSNFRGNNNGIYTNRIGWSFLIQISTFYSRIEFWLNCPTFRWLEWAVATVTVTQIQPATVYIFPLSHLYKRNKGYSGVSITEDESSQFYTNLRGSGEWMCSHLQLASSVAENPDPKQLGDPCTFCVRPWSRDHDSRDHDFPTQYPIPLNRHESTEYVPTYTPYVCILLCMRIRPVPKIFPLQIWPHRPYWTISWYVFVVQNQGNASGGEHGER